MTRNDRPRFASGLVALIAAGLCGAAHSQVATWQDPTGGNWFDPTNWLEGVVPGPTGQAVFALGSAPTYDVTVTQSTAIRGLSVGFDHPRLVLSPGVTLTVGTNGILVDGLATPQNAFMRCAGGHVVTSKINLSPTASHFSYLTLEGSTDWEVTGNVQLGSNGTGALSVTDGSALDVGGSINWSSSGLSSTTLLVQGANSRVSVGGDFLTVAGMSFANVWSGALLEVPGNMKLAMLTGNGGVAVDGANSRATIGGTLDVGYFTGGTAWWANMSVTGGGAAEVNGEIRVGSLAGGIYTTLFADNGGTIIGHGDLRIGTQGISWAGLLDVRPQGFLTLDGDIVSAIPAVSGHSTITGPIQASGLYVAGASGFSGGANTIIEARGTTHASGATLGTATEIRGRGGKLDCNVSTGGMVQVRLEDGGADSIGIGGNLTMASSCLTWLQIGADNYGAVFVQPPPPLIKVDGTLALAGSLVIDAYDSTNYMSAPRAPIVIAQASTLTGSFSSVSISDGPGVSPLELKQTSTKLILQWDFAADLDDDGSVNGSDLTMLLAAWGTPGPGDLNGDGQVRGDDLMALLGQWTLGW